MTGYLIVLVVGFTVSGLYNMGRKARKQEQTDEDFFRKQLHLARQQCHEIALQFSDFLCDQRTKYLRKDQYGNLIYDDWFKLGIEPFFHSKVSPRLVDVQRDFLINYGNYTEIIDHVARTGNEKRKQSIIKQLTRRRWLLS